MKRNYVDEILEVKERVADKRSALLFLPARLAAVEALFASRAQLAPEAHKYFPIAVVACSEAYFRWIVCDFIDSDPKFAENIEALNVPNLKFDTALVRAIAGKTITLGELVAHLVPLKNLESLDSCISVLSGEPFLRNLDKFTDARSGEPSAASPVLKNASTVFADVARTFELRNIYAHEAITDHRDNVDTAEIERCVQNFIVFLKAAAKYLWRLRYPGPSLTQTEMNQLAAKTFDELEAQRLALNEKMALKLDGKRKEQFDYMSALFVEYRDAYADFFTSRYEGGTIRPCLFSSDQSRLTQEYIDRLKPETEDEW
jgi:hypothetical protein